MSGLQIHGRVQVDITDDDHTHYTTEYSYKFKKCWQKCRFFMFCPCVIYVAF